MGRTLVALALVLNGCLELRRSPPPANPHSNVFTEEVGDGSHYIEVVAQPTLPPQAVRGKWKRAATRVCDGDYLVLSEHAAERRRGSFVDGRVHEGWVRCISPDVTAKEAKQG
jgi:hypothetical protein